MYWHFKLLFVLFGLAIVAGLVLAFRSYLPSLPRRAPKPPPVAPADPVPGQPPADPGLAASVNVQGEEAIAALQKIALAQKHVADQKLVEARGLLENVLRAPGIPMYSDIWYKAARALTDVNSTLLFTDAPCPEKITYVVKRGDSLWQIAKNHNLNLALIQRSNNLDPTDPKLLVGATLRLFQADWNILVSKSQFALQLRNGDRLLKLYEIGVGKQDRTPVGTFRIVSREVDPVWTYQGKKFPFGDPQNILGTRWMGLEPTGTTAPEFRGYGIHGTWEPLSIGKRESNGCVRMRNPEVDELYDLVPLYTPVTIDE
jgi:lipoprotein-anchoring transpeptidase ErfK/SrfK